MGIVMLEHLTKLYKKRTWVQNLSLSIETGQVLGGLLITAGTVVLIL